MAKVFSFTSVLRKNMMEKDKPDLYYALAKSSGEIDIDAVSYTHLTLPTTPYV